MMESTNPQPAPIEAGFSLQDLESTIRIIDVACSRGAFHGEEMSSVGNVRDRIADFLSKTAQQKAHIE